MEKYNDEKFLDLLNQHYQWPSEYTFKFIVPKKSIDELIKIIGTGKITKKPSKRGNYSSVTLILSLNSAEEVIEVYKKVSVVEGIISL